MKKNIFVNSEVGSLQRLIIHSPDKGLGKVVPSKAQDWLFEDIIHLNSMRKNEYDYYVKLLLYFLDKDLIQGKIKALDEDSSRNFYKPHHPDYFKSDNVIEFERLLIDILFIPEVKMQLIAAVSAVEKCSFLQLNQMSGLNEKELCELFITGSLPDGKMLFPPIPNLIFTRDIGIMVNDHLLMNKPAKYARTREALLAKYVFFNHPLFLDLKDKIIEISEDENHFLLSEDEQVGKLNTLEGGDVMMVAPNHLLIGISERTSIEAARQAIDLLFSKKVVSKVSLIKIPQKRDYMHIDTVFTQIKKNVWVLLGSLGRSREDALREEIWEELGQKPSYESLIIKQFIDKDDEVKIKNFDNLEDLLSSVTKDDLNCYEEVKFVYSGNNQFPFGAREQWTDSCNLLVLREGVAVGYDRNDQTALAFRNIGFQTITAHDLLEKFEASELNPETLTDTIIMLPSSELSRARGGSHCMSMPILRILD